MDDFSSKVFVCFAAEDRYDIAEPLVYHLKNFGVEVWYDRYALLLGDDRRAKNLIEGAQNCRYALTILSKHTYDSKCTMEELSIIRSRYTEGKVTIFPVLFDLSPNYMPEELLWIKDAIFKEVSKHSGTRDVCNHIATRITEDILQKYKSQSIQDIVEAITVTPIPIVDCLLRSYLEVDCENLNARIALLYATHLVIVKSHNKLANATTRMIAKVFSRMFDETRLNLAIDYRDIWLLENALCVLFGHYFDSCTESKI